MMALRLLAEMHPLTSIFCGITIICCWLLVIDGSDGRMVMVLLDFTVSNMVTLRLRLYSTNFRFLLTLEEFLNFLKVERFDLSGLKY